MKILIHNEKTGECKLTKILPNTDKFKKRYGDFKPIGFINGLNVTCRNYDETLLKYVK